MLTAIKSFGCEIGYQAVIKGKSRKQLPGGLEFFETSAHIQQLALRFGQLIKYFIP